MNSVLSTPIVILHVFRSEIDNVIYLILRLSSEIKYKKTVFRPLN